MVTKSELMEAVEIIEAPKRKELKPDLYFVVLTPGELACRGSSVEVAGELLSPEQVFERGQKDPTFFFTPLGILNARSTEERENIMKTIRKERSGAYVTFFSYMFCYPNGSVPGFREKMFLQDLREDGTIFSELRFQLPCKGEEQRLGLNPEYRKYLQLQEPRRPGELGVVLKSAVLV